jgi:hypothetical protein
MYATVDALTICHKKRTFVQHLTRQLFIEGILSDWLIYPKIAFCHQKPRFKVNTHKNVILDKWLIYLMNPVLN